MVIEIARSTSKTDNESINFDSPDAGTYYIKVKSVGSPGNSYDLVWDDIVSIEFRSIEGLNNNLENPDWGTPDSQLIRLSESAYNDGISEPRGGDPSSLANPRELVMQFLINLSPFPMKQG